MPQLLGVERALRRAFLQRAQSARPTFLCRSPPVTEALPGGLAHFRVYGGLSFTQVFRWTSSRQTGDWERVTILVGLDVVFLALFSGQSAEGRAASDPGQ